MRVKLLLRQIFIYIKKQGAVLLLAQEQKTVMLGVWLLVTLLLALQLSSSAHPITTAWAWALLCYTAEDGDHLPGVWAGAQPRLLN